MMNNSAKGFMNRNCTVAITIVFLFSFTGYAENQSRQYEITVPILEGQIKVDGYLDEEFWKNAAKVSNFTQAEPEEGAKPTVKTEVLLWSDRVNLYIGFICHDESPSKIRATRTERDRFTFGDWVQIHLATHNPPTWVYDILVNPMGVQIDALSTLEKSDAGFDFNWKAASMIFDDRWTVEIVIPFRNLRFEEKKQHHWRVDFSRIYPREREEFSSWIPHSKDQPHSFNNMGHLYINSELIVGKSLDLLPYIIGTINRPAEDKNIESRIGLSGRYWISSNAIIDWALRPDYSQIEADMLQIDVNTPFALYYPEKRPMFLERKDIFDSYIPVVYTRTINDPIVALKSTGRFSRTDIGYIFAWDKQTPWILPFRDMSFPIQSTEKSVSNILRVNQKLGRDSRVGFIATSRELGNGFNRVVSCDGKIAFLKNYRITWQGALSFTQEIDDTSLFSGWPGLDFKGYTSGFDGERFTGNAFSVNFTRDARYLDFNLWYDGYSPEFRADNGFIQFNNRINRGINANISLYPNRFMVEQITPGLEIVKSTSYDNGIVLESNIKTSLSATLKRQLSLSLGYSRSATVFQGQKFDGLWEYKGSFSYFLQNILLGMYWRYGKGINYLVFPAELGRTGIFGGWLNFAPFSILSINLSFGRYLLWNEQGEKSIDRSILTSELIYSLTQHTTWRFNIQHSPGGGGTYLSQLFSLKPTPFTLLYVGSNHNLQFSSHRVKSEDLQLFLKIQYLFSFH